ncbi:TPA: hypothetical protein ACGW3F_003165 [Bacillus paranthracis]
MYNFVWSVCATSHQQEKNIKLALYDKNNRPYQYKIIIDVEEDFPIVSKEVPLQECGQEIVERIMRYFSQKNNVDLSSNDSEKAHQNNIDSQNLNFRKKILYKNILMEYIPKYLVENQNQNIVEMTLLTRFLHSSHILSDFNTGFVTSNIEIINYKLISHVCRLGIFIKILKILDDKDQNASLTQHFHLINFNQDNFKKSVVHAFYNEFERFVDFVENTNFNTYVLNEKEEYICNIRVLIQRFCEELEDSTYNNYIQNKELIEIDGVVDVLLKTFLKTDERLRKQIDVPFNEKKISNIVTKLINKFYLPRYSVEEAKKLKNYLTDQEKKNLSINLTTPRLIASILIGFVPVILTGEINEWVAALVTGQIGDNHKTLGFLGPYPWITTGMVLLLFCMIALLFCYKYIQTEIYNILGYHNKFYKKKVSAIFLRGLCISFWISLIGNITFTFIYNYGNTEMLREAIMTSIFLFMIQVSFAFTLGLIIQAVWEDKPLTQPL